MTELAVVVLIMAGLMALLDWRNGLAMCVFVGVVQDPLRKLAPGQPVFYVVLVVVIFALAWVRAALLRVPLGPSVIVGWRKNLKVPFSLFIALTVMQAFHSFVAYGSVYLPLVGVLVWLSPIPAVVLAYQFAVRRELPRINRLLILYVGLAMLALSGVYLEYTGYTSRLLGEVGEGQIIYDVGTVLKAYSGFFRASEIAAWHTAACACFIFMLSVGKRPTLMRVGAGLAIIAVLVTLGMLTGRRKMLVEITVFLSCYFFLVAWLQRGMARLGVVVAVMGAVAYVLIVGFVSPDLVKRDASKEIRMENANRIEGYAVRGQSVFADLPRRVRDLGVEPVVWAVDNFGWLGAGLGTGSQGTSEITDRHGIERWAAEGGLGKVAMELGVPGLAIALWLLVALGKHVHRQLRLTMTLSPQHARMSYGLVAFLVANAATFSVATQAYSDPFILLILGWCLGFLLAMPQLAARAAQAPQKAARVPMGRHAVGGAPWGPAAAPLPPLRR